MMKRRQYLFSLVLFVHFFIGNALHAQNENYHKDALQLAARLSEQEAVSELSEHLIHTLEEALTAVSESSYYASEIVAQYYDIHAAASSSTQRLRLVVDNSASWLKNVKGDNPIQQFLSRSGIQLCISEQAQKYTTVELFSGRALNMKFLAAQLSLLEHIWLVEIPSEQNAEQDIQVQALEEGYRFIFSRQAQGRDSALHYWEFKVYASGEVVFLGEYGATLIPPPPPPSERL
jgi:hypothetical protein